MVLVFLMIISPEDTLCANFTNPAGIDTGAGSPSFGTLVLLLIFAPIAMLKKRARVIKMKDLTILNNFLRRVANFREALTCSLRTDTLNVSSMNLFLMRQTRKKCFVLLQFCNWCWITWGKSYLFELLVYLSMTIAMLRHSWNVRCHINSTFLRTLSEWYQYLLLNNQHECREREYNEWTIYV